MYFDIKLNDKITEFSNQVLFKREGVYHSRSNNASRRKIFFDIYYGKYAEFHVYHHFKGRGYDISEPCLVVGDDYQDADLIIKQDVPKFIHVKSYKHNSSIKNSWAMGLNQKYVVNPSENDYFALCSDVDEDSCGIHLLKCSDAIYKETLLYNPNKKAIYLNDIKHLTSKIN